MDGNKTKTSYVIILAGIGMILAFFIGRVTAEKSESKINGLYSTDTRGNNDNNADVVYVCTGQNAKKYHTTPSCRWLENCSGDIGEVSLSYAKNQGKTPCKGCH